MYVKTQKETLRIHKKKAEHLSGGRVKTTRDYLCSYKLKRELQFLRESHRHTTENIKKKKTIKKMFTESNLNGRQEVIGLKK